VSENHYEVLGVEPAATRDELRTAYRARVDELTAARERKGVTERQLQENREEVARVRSAWNVLSDPFQRQRYDGQVGEDERVAEGDVEIVEDAGDRPEVQLTGWRRLMAPQAAAGAGGGAGGGRATPPTRPQREPTIPLPPGVHIAQPRVRGMALLFDLAVVIIIFTAVQYLVPPLVQSDYRDKQEQILSIDEAKAAKEDLQDAEQSIDDANEAIANAENSGNDDDVQNARADLESAQDDRRGAREDLEAAQEDFNERQENLDLTDQDLSAMTPNQLDALSDQLADDTRSTGYVVQLTALVLILLYLVPVTVATGSTLGMKGRKIRVVRVDGSRAGWVPVFARFVVPVLLALAVPLYGSLVALGIVLWGYRDPNGQGVHDKLARTLVVDA
jgi:F0F1-type ATP synthase membrane subunit b/b'